MKRFFHLLFTLIVPLILTTGCSFTIESVDPKVSWLPAPSKIRLTFVNQTEQAINFTLFTGYDELRHKSLRYLPTIHYNQKRIALYKQQIRAIAALQKRLTTYPDYLIEIHNQELQKRLIAENEAFQRATPAPKGHDRLISGLFKEIYPIGTLVEPAESITIELTNSNAKTLVVGSNNQQLYNAIELAHFSPKAGQHYLIEYWEEYSSSHFLNHKEPWVLTHNVIRIAHLDDKNRERVVVSTSPKEPLMDSPEKFDLMSYQLLLTLFERVY